jgi:hypothetical protein
MAVVQVYDWQMSSGGCAALVQALQAMLALWQPVNGVPAPHGARFHQASGTPLVVMTEWDTTADAQAWRSAIERDPEAREYLRKVQALAIPTTGPHYWTALYGAAPM